MRLSGEQRRARVFRRYSSNLELWRPELKGQYICPLCLGDGFDENAVIGAQPRLTEEHCIPRGLGKTVIVLTCVACNSGAGSGVDSHLHKRTDFYEFWNGTLNESFNAKISICGEELSVGVRRSPGEMALHVHDRASDPAKVKAVQDRLESGVRFDGLELHLGPKYVPDTKRSRIAVLKAAYLLLFRHFGYAYVLSSVLDPVREQIGNPASESVPLEAIVFNVPIEHLPHEVTSINKPDGLGGFGVPVPLSKRGIGYLVILPSDSTTFRRWTRFAKGRDRTQSLECEFNLIPFNESLLSDRPFTWRNDRGEATDADAKHDSSDNCEAEKNSAN